VDVTDEAAVRQLVERISQNSSVWTRSLMLWRLCRRSEGMELGRGLDQMLALNLRSGH